MGKYADIHYYNRDNTENYNYKVLSYVRWSQNEKLVVIANFDADESYSFELKIPMEIIKEWGLKEGSFKMTDTLYGETIKELNVVDGIGRLIVEIDPLESFIFRLSD